MISPTTQATEGRSSGFTQSRLDIFRIALGDANDELLKHLEAANHGSLSRALDAAPQSLKTDEVVGKLELANLVADAAHEGVTLAFAILEDPQATSRRQIALNFGLAKIQELATQTNPNLATTAALSGDAHVDATAASLALRFRRRIFEAEPTAVLQQMISATSESVTSSARLRIHAEERICKLVAKFLDHHPQFNIRNQSVLSVIKADQQSTTGGSTASLDSQTRQQVYDSLKLLQRVQALTPTPEAIQSLIAVGMTSALRVSSLPRHKFVKLMMRKIASCPGVNEHEAQGLALMIHHHATSSRARADSTLLQLHQALKGSGLAPVDGTTTLAERKVLFTAIAEKSPGSQGIVNLDDLFQDMDFCQCDSCEDVTSPTAYYVDLLQYLRNNNLDTKTEWPNTGEEGYEDTVLEKLFIRRPDLQHLQLTCENANTVLPYIDLSNEIMESFVIHLDNYSENWTPSKQVSLETWNVDGEDTSELLASPQHTRKPAYCILKAAVFPIASLPYFQPLDAMRLYLQYLGVSRYELINIFRLATRQWRVSSSLLTPEKEQLFVELRGQLQERAATAECLGISPDEYVIITRESTWPLSCSLFSDNGTLLTMEQYREDIGVKPPEVYWGYNSAAALMNDNASTKTGLTWVKSQFLPRSGLSYADTVELVRTYYVNPMFPSGRDKYILDAIRFSYRFLQRLAAAYPTQAQRIDAIANFLFITQPWVHLVESLQEAPTGNPLIKSKPRPKLQRKEIKKWLSRWFDCIGKLVVLESGQGPRFPMKGFIIHYPQSSERASSSDSLRSSMIRLMTSTTTPSAPSSQVQPAIIGYLDNSGEIHDLSNKLVGAVDMSGRVLYREWKPIRQWYPTGTLLVVDVSKDAIVNPQNPDDNAEEAPLVIAQVDSESYMYINRLRVQWIIPAPSCSIENTRLLHLNGTHLELWEYDRINRFIRLYIKLQPDSWTISQLDSCLKGLAKVPELPASASPTDPLRIPSSSDDEFSFSRYKDKGCGCKSDGEDDSCGGSDDHCDDQGPSPCDPRNFLDISPGFLNQLKAVKDLWVMTGLQDELFALWTDIESFGDKSLFVKTFVTPNLRSIDPVFQPDDDGNYLTAQPKIKDHIPVLLAALKLKPNIFDTILRRAGLTGEDIMTISTLSKLYRIKILAKVLRMSQATLVDALDIFTHPFASASRTLEIYHLWNRLSAASLSIKQLRYILLNIDDPLQPLGPKQLTILKTTNTMLDGLRAIEAANPDFAADQESRLTASDVKAKATEIFAPAVVDSIMGLLEGTSLYTTNCPAALVVDRAKIPDKVIYNDPGTPANRRATLSVKGVLTEGEESSTINLFPGNEAWRAAVGRLRKQAVNRAKSNLAAVYPDNIDDAVLVLAKGDVIASPPASEGEPGDPGTAPEKRAFFVRALMPFLRSQLAAQFITTTMSGIASTSPEMTLLLLTKIIRVGQGNPNTTAMEVLKGLTKHLTTPPEGAWTGYLLPKFTDKFSFYGFGETQPPPLVLDGQNLAFVHRNEDPNDLWWTEPVSLTGGKLYSLSVTGQTVPGGLQWKTDRNGLAAIPASSLIPGASIGDTTEVFNRLIKTSMLIQAFNLEIAEVEYFQIHPTDFDAIDFNAMTFGALKRLLAYTELRTSLNKREKTLIDLFLWATQNPTATLEQLSTIISLVTMWDKSQILTLIGANNFGFGNPSLFRNEIALTKLGNAIGFVQKVGLRDVDLLLSWADLKLDFDPTWCIAKSILHTIRERYTLEDFVQAIKPSHDQLRKNQRDALIAYLLMQPCLQKWGVSDANGLFEFFLLDVQMGACMQTSRLKQAISSVQQFVQRCMLGLAEHADPLINVPNDALDAARWQWMSKQTIWTANRKVFLYPENWLVPSLRDAKTPIYTTMEGEMLQRDLNPPNILESFKEYVSDLDQISHLKAVGLHIEETGASKYILHCIGMTPGSPYLFFYRAYDSFVQEWTPWSQVDTDIPTYTQEYLRVHGGGEFPPQTMEVLTGCYTVPYVWNSRRLLFIGQINQKTIANEGALMSEFGQLTKPDSRTRANDMAPKQCWEVKLAYTEYRSGRWSQKQASTDSILTPENVNLSPSDAFQFMPQSLSSGGEDYISIEVWQCHQDPMNSSAPTNVGSFIGQFIFDGSLIYKGALLDSEKPSNWVATNFQLVNGRSSGPTASSLQRDTDGALPYFNKEPCVKYEIQGETTAALDRQGIVHYSSSSSALFFHPFTNKLLRAANKSKEDIGPILRVFKTLGDRTSAIAAGAFGLKSSEVGSDGRTYPTYSELSQPYSNYNWELGFHAPMQVAQNLMTSQQFDSALEMMHHVFDPYADGPDAKRVWQWPPFKDANSAKVLEAIFNQLKPREFDQRITQWRDSPFRPHVVARGRIVAYMKWTVMTYIKTLISYGDYYFRRRTLEDLPRAIQLYVLASHMYGKRGEQIPRQGKKIPQSYFSLLNKWDAFSNAAVELELMFPYSNQTPFPWGVTQGTLNSSFPGIEEIALANIFGFATSTYFCLPTNPELQALRTTIDTRLYNIRNCLDIDGKPMPLALWEPPIDPAQLVAAVASGLSLGSALNDLNVSLPNYRFAWLLTKAFEVCAELKSLEGNFLAIKEKRDGEALQRLRTSHEITMGQKAIEMKKVQLNEAMATLDTMVASQESPRYRFEFYSSLAGAEAQALGSGQPFKPLGLKIEAPSADGDLHMTSVEKEEAEQAKRAQIWNQVASGHEVLAGILHSVPSFNIHTTPMGCGVEVAWGMPNIASSLQAKARTAQMVASRHSFKSTEASRKAANIRQYQDRIQQMNIAGLEFEHVNSQIAAQKVRIQLANMDMNNQQKVLDNSKEVDEFLRNKYTNDELYTYLESSTRQNMYQTYQLAFDLAKKAELAYRFERKTPAGQTNFISFGYFDPGRDGLQSGQQLYLALKRMEAAYQADRGHDFELTKTVSLRQLNPYALLTLRETGSCQIDLAEVLFDMDFPGHYFRRLKTVSLTIPCVVGPYTGINATLRLLRHRYRWNAISTGSGQDYLEKMEGKLDDRFRTDFVPIDAIAASTGQNDSGVFELSIRDERYLPFEGAGAVGSWLLQLPTFAQFDYHSITDVMLTIRYTSCDGGMLLQKAASESVANYISTIEGYSQSQGLLTLFDLRSDFASEWAKLSTPLPGSSDSEANIRTLVLRELAGRLPAFTRGRQPSAVRATDVAVITTLPLRVEDLTLNLAYVAPTRPDGGSGGDDIPFDSGPTKIGKDLNMYRLNETDSTIENWALKIAVPAGTQIDSSSRMWMIVRYKMRK